MNERSTAPDIIRKCRFACSHLERVDERGDHWHTMPMSFDMAREILIMNGFSPVDADDALTDIVDFEEYIMVGRTNLQMC